MNDQDPTLPPRDELASAYLDGALDAAGRRRVEADPVLLAEVDDLRGVRTAVGRPVAVDPARRDHAVARALDAAGLAAPAGRPGAVRPAWRWAVPLGGAVAAAAAVVGLVLVADQPEPSPTAVATTTAATADDAFAEASADAAAPPAGGSEGSTTARAATGADLGALETPDDLVAAVAAASGRPAGTSACGPPTPGAVFVGTARWQGTPAEIFATATEAFAVDAITCAVAGAAPRG